MKTKEYLKNIENTLVSNVNRDTLMDYTRNISQWVRITSQPAEVESLNYVGSVMESFGYRVELLRYNGFISYPVQASVDVLSPEPMTLKALGHCFTDSTPEEGLTAPLSDDAENCNGCICLIDGLPNYGAIMKAKKNGALAVLCVQDNYLHNMPVNPIWGSPTKDTQRFLPRLSVASITHPDGEKLRRMMAAGTVTVQFRSQVEMGWKTGLPVLVCDLPSKVTDKFAMLSCHIDSWDYGAMDNGSANATAIECARLLAKYQDELTRGLRVLFWSGHSQGKFCGSSWYADTHYEELEQRCIAHVNIDSTGGRGAVVVEEPPVMPHTRKLAATVIEEQTGVSFIGKRIGHFADQSFFGVGLSSLFGTFSEQDPEHAAGSLSFKHGVTIRASGLGWWWHTEHDTIDKIDPDFLRRDTQIYVSVLWHLLTDEILPLDFASAVADMSAEAEKLQTALGNRYDLTRLTARISYTGSLVARLTRRAETIQDFQTAEEYNTVLQRLSQCFVRAQFTVGNEYDFDLGTSMTNIPALSEGYTLAKAAEGSEEYFMSEISLRRGLNRVMHLLKEACSIMENYLS